MKKPSKNRPYIAKDTKEPLIILGGYPVAEDGSIMRNPLPKLEPNKDYGADPLGDGTFRMIPSGDIVDYVERCKRLNQ